MSAQSFSKFPPPHYPLFTSRADQSIHVVLRGRCRGINNSRPSLSLSRLSALGSRLSGGGKGVSSNRDPPPQKKKKEEKKTKKTHKPNQKMVRRKGILAE